MDGDDHVSSPLRSLDSEQQRTFQWCFYMKLTSIKTIIKTKHVLELIEERRHYHDLLKEDLERAGLEVVELWRKKDSYKYHWGITASDERLLDHADLIHYELPLRDDLGRGIVPYYSDRKHLYFVHPDGTILSDLDRQRLVMSIIQYDDPEKHDPSLGAARSAQVLLRDKTVYKIFPMHDKEKQDWLFKNWVTKPHKRQPIDKIRDYLGEKVAFYFAFMGYCIKWLLPLSIVGIIVFVSQLIPSFKPYSYIGSSAFSILMPMWATLFIDFWKRKTTARAANWGMDHLDIREESRRGYGGALRSGLWWGSEWLDFSSPPEGYSALQHRMSTYELPSRRFKRMLVASAPVIIGMLILSLAMAFFFIMLTAYVGAQTGLVAGISVINGFVIVILSVIYRKIAYWLTEFENHRTETDAENSTIIKVFIFDYVNAFTSISYQAFFKYNVTWPTLDWMNGGLCTLQTGTAKFSCVQSELALQLITIFLVRIFFFQALDFIVPFLYTKISVFITKQRSRKSNKTNPGSSTIQSKMAPFRGTLDEYSGMVMQWGYIIMFAACFPLGPAIAFISFMLEIRTDAYKILKLCQRAPAKPAKDIGIYAYILEMMGYISIFTNAALIAFSDHPSSSDLAWRMFLVILCENAVLAVKFCISAFVPAVPSNTRLTLAKRAFVKEELIKLDHLTQEKRDSMVPLEEEPIKVDGTVLRSTVSSRSLRLGPLNSRKPLSDTIKFLEGVPIRTDEEEEAVSSDDEEEDINEESGLLAHEAGGRV